MNTSTLPVEKDKHVTNVESEYDKYCCARELFIGLRPNWIVLVISACAAIGVIGYGLGVAKQDLLVALLCLSGAVVFMIGIVIMEHWRIHRRMEALAEMRLRGKTFNF